MSEHAPEVPEASVLPWCLRFEDEDPERELSREALCTLANGRFGVRGASASVLGSDATHYPGCYVAGLYDRLSTRIDGTPVEYEELVNLPNWLPLLVRFEDGSTLADAERLSSRRELDLARGVLMHEHRVSHRGGILRVREQRLVHRRDQHLAFQELTLESESFAGEVRVEAWIDGRIANTNAKEYEGLDRVHLERHEPHHQGALQFALRARTRGSRVELALAARCRVHEGALNEARPLHAPERVGAELKLALRPGQRFRLDKTVALYTGRDSVCTEPLAAAQRAVANADGFSTAVVSQETAWRRLWHEFTIETPHTPRIETMLRVHAFHLLQSLADPDGGLDVGVTARGLHGENYHGHVFWDELFVLPFFNLRWPRLSRSLLLYRYRRLAEARVAARELGLRGAMFPWRSASDGREVTDRLRKNPCSERWIADHSRLQRHINAAIVYNVWSYVECSGDHAFMLDFGAELVLSIACFWASAAELDPLDGRYHLRGVVGPDEFHDAYPGAERPGIDDNAYTNVMAVWCLMRALELCQKLPRERLSQLMTALDITHEEVQHWDHVSRHMVVYFHGDGVMSQFRGFDELEPFPWDAHRQRHGDNQRLDNVLEAEGDSINRYQACKQADVLMLFYLLPQPELRALLSRLGYSLDAHACARNVRYYLPRTSHGSTLSRIVHAWVLTRLDRERSWSMLRPSLGAELTGLQGVSAAEGVHLGAMAGSLDIFQRAYLGLEVVEGTLCIDPRLPSALQALRVRLCFRQRWLAIEVARTHLTVRLEGEGDPPLRLCVSNRAVDLMPGQAYYHPLLHGEHARGEASSTQS